MTNEKRNKMQGKGTEKQARISFILFLCILALLLATTFVGCSKEVDVPFKKPILSLTIDPMLPKDANSALRCVLSLHQSCATVATGTVVPSHRVSSLETGSALNQSGSM